MGRSRSVQPVEYRAPTAASPRRRARARSADGGRCLGTQGQGSLKAVVLMTARTAGDRKTKGKMKAKRTADGARGERTG